MEYKILKDFEFSRDGQSTCLAVADEVRADIPPGQVDGLRAGGFIVAVRKPKSDAAKAPAEKTARSAPGAAAARGSSSRPRAKS